MKNNQVGILKEKKTTTKIEVNSINNYSSKLDTVEEKVGKTGRKVSRNNQKLKTDEQKIARKSSGQNEISNICIIRVLKREDIENMSTVYLKI